MPLYTKESLEKLREKVDLVDLLSSHIEFKKAGASYKALCPFHDEKTPSFMIQKGDTHYHCFGCGAHGDAVTFLMQHQRLSFGEAVENLAQKFHVHLEVVEGGGERKGPPKAVLKDTLELAVQFYHFCLLYTPEGHAALHYLYDRGIDLDFIRHFRLGWAPKGGGLRHVLHAKFISDETMVEAGLLAEGKSGGYKEFFHDRITFPICDGGGTPIGFSARLFKKETFGGKYVNTPETPLFKKSKVLFGLHHSRRRIAKEQKALIVEGQIDALRLIHQGFNITVASQGTAFGEGHVKELINLGLKKVYLAFDSDSAGQEATVKVGDLFLRQGIEVCVVTLPTGSDPDSFLVSQGVEAFANKMEEAVEYLQFLIDYQGRQVNLDVPAAKATFVSELARRIRAWEQPLLVHESLKKLAQLTKTPENLIGVDQDPMPNIYIKKSGVAGPQKVDPDRVLETDVLKWLLEMGVTHPHFVQLAQGNVHSDQFRVPVCRQFYELYLGGICDPISLLAELEEGNGQELLDELMQKRVNREKGEETFKQALLQILKRNWMLLLEEIKIKIQSGNSSEEEALLLAKQFAELRGAPPTLKCPV